MVESDHSDAIQLEPIQLPSTSKLFPFPGFTIESAEKVRELLDENHKVRFSKKTEASQARKP